MKKTSTLILVLLSLSFAAATTVEAQTNSLASLGSDNFTVLFTNEASVTQTATNLTSISPQTFGGIFAGEFAVSYNWSSFADTNNWTFGLLMSVPGANPLATFTVEFYESDLLTIIAEYQGGTALATSNTSFVPLGLSAIGSSNYSDVKAFQLTWDASGTGNVVINDVAVALVPEPSTWALLVTASVLSAFLAWRRRSLARH